MGKLVLGSNRTRSRLADQAVAVAPTLPFTDDFNRSNRTLNGDNGWAVTVSPGTVTIASNAVLAQSVSNGAWMSNSSLSVSNTNHYAEITIASGLAGDIGGALCRFTNNNNFYIGRCSAAGADTYEIYKRVASTYTLLNSLAQAFPAQPFRIKLEVNGTALVLSLWNGSSWVSKVSTTDAALSTGTPGFFSQSVVGDVTFEDYAHGNT